MALPQAAPPATDRPAPAPALAVPMRQPPSTAAQHLADSDRPDATAVRLAEATRARRSLQAPQLAKAAGLPPPPRLGRWLQAAGQDVDDPAWPLSAAQRRVLRRLADTAATAWQPQPGPLPVADAATRELHWRDGQGVAASLRLEPSGLRWIEADGRHWFAALDPAALQALSREF